MVDRDSRIPFTPEQSPACLNFLPSEIQNTGQQSRFVKECAKEVVWCGEVCTACVVECVVRAMLFCLCELSVFAVTSRRVPSAITVCRKDIGNA